MNDFKNDSEPKQSKYNAALAQLYRVDNLWKSAHFNSRSGNLKEWNWDLDSIWRELASDAIPKDNKKFYTINNLIKRYKKNKPQFYRILEYKEIFLRKLQNSQGKGSAYYEDDEGL